MKKFFKIVQKDSVLSWTFWLTIIFIVVMAGFIAVFFTNLPPLLPLYNQMPWGYERLGHSFELFYLPLGTLIVCIVNTIIGIKLIEKVPLLARFLFLTMTGLALFTCVFLARLIFLVL